MMRLLIIASEKGSLTNFRGDLIQQFVSRGARVYAAAPGLAGDVREAAELKGLGAIPAQIRHLRRNAIGIVSDLRAFISMSRLIRQVKPDLVMAYTVKPVIYGLLAARLLGVPQRVALITGLGYSFIESGQEDYRRRLVSKIVRFLYRVSLSGATKVFFQNPDDRKSFIAQRIIGPTAPTCVVNGSGVNLKRFHPSPLPEGRVTFLMVGRILRDKGVAEYIAAGAQLKREFPNIDVVLAGPLDSNPGGINQCEFDSLLSGSGIKYLGPVSDVRALIAACHVFVLPSYREGTPRTVLEAMAIGRAIVTTDVPGCRETVRDAFNGYLVSVKSADELQKAMQRFLDTPSLMETMGENSLRLAREKYDVDKVNASIVRELGL